MSPLPNTRVIPTGWSAHHAPVAAGGMNGLVRIYDPATATTGWDPVNEAATLDRGTPTYDGPARIEAMLSATDAVQADDQETTRSYLVQILFDAAQVEKDWVLIPYGCINDPQLDGTVMTVDDAQMGTERFTRDLVASHTQT
jgi:hypothetical protein